MSSSGHYEPEEDNISRSQSTPRDEPISPKESTRAVESLRFRALENLLALLPPQSIEAYTDVLDAPSDLDTGNLPGDAEGEYDVTQNGAVIWTPEEKKILFQCLDRKGRDGIPEIARAIESKSELEVLDYLRLLHNGLQGHHLTSEYIETIALGDVPTAAEISEQCCEALDHYADLLSWKEQRENDADGKARHRDLWIIDRATAEQIETQLQTQDSKLETGSSIDFSARLFNMKNWVELSERLFMNSSGNKFEDNWVNIAFADETPSITADAFEDFYKIVYKFTQRIVQMTLFFAASRLQHTRDDIEESEVVRPCDVETALRVLDMKRDGLDFWVGLARRCNLDVIEVRHRKGWKPVALSHDEVEDKLSKNMRPPDDRREFLGTVFKDQSEDEKEDAVEFERSSTPNFSVQSSTIIDDVHKAKRKAKKEEEEEKEVKWKEMEELGDPEDVHAEEVDRRMSCLEELGCWTLLQQPVPEWLNSELSHLHAQSLQPTQEEFSFSERKGIRDLVDWRDVTLYRSFWERDNRSTIGQYQESPENPHKRQRVERPSSPIPTPHFQSTSLDTKAIDGCAGGDNFFANAKTPMKAYSQSLQDDIETESDESKPDLNPIKDDTGTSSPHQNATGCLSETKPNITSDPPTEFTAIAPNSPHSSLEFKEEKTPHNLEPDRSNISSFDSSSNSDSDSDPALRLPDPPGLGITDEDDDDEYKVKDDDDDEDDYEDQNETTFFSAPMTPIGLHSEK